MPHTLPTEQPEAASGSGTLVLVRHGERADFVKTHPWYANRVPRQRDPPLTDAGIRLALRTGERLVRDGYAPRLCTAAVLDGFTSGGCGGFSGTEAGGRAVVLSSPLARCLMTAAALAARLDAEIVVVYSLAKSTAYFRRVKAGRYGAGAAAEVAGAEEAQRIVRATDAACAGVRIARYVGDDGRTCHGALDRLVRAAARQGRVALVAGHCESQLELSRLSGADRMDVPYCGVATFVADGVDCGPARWRVAETPLAHRARCMHREREDDDG